jgi:hypothetical protein
MPSGQRAAVATRRESGSPGIASEYPGSPGPVLNERLNRIGLRGWHLHVASMSSVGLCIVLWIRAKTVDQDERGNAERRALFVGLWPPTLYLMGDSLERAEARRQRKLVPWS